jgi:hypothetical protein
MAPIASASDVDASLLLLSISQLKVSKPVEFKKRGAARPKARKLPSSPKEAAYLERKREKAVEYSVKREANQLSKESQLASLRKENALARVQLREESAKKLESIVMAKFDSLWEIRAAEPPYVTKTRQRTSNTERAKKRRACDDRKRALKREAERDLEDGLKLALFESALLKTFK